MTGTRTFHYAEELLRHFRPEYDSLKYETKAALIEGVCDRINKVRTATEELVSFSEYGTQGKKLKPKIKDARRDVEAAILHHVENMSIQQVGEKLGAHPPGQSNEIKKDHPTVREWIRRGNDLLVGAFGVDGWRDRAEAMKIARRWHRQLNEQEQMAEEMADSLALHGDIPLSQARQILRQDDPGEDINEHAGLMWAIYKALLDSRR